MEVEVQSLDMTKSFLRLQLEEVLPADQEKDNYTQSLDSETHARAPIKKRTNIRAKIANKSRPAPQPAPSRFAAEAAADDDDDDTPPSAFSSFANNKRDKRVMKHSAFITKIEKNSQKKAKRSRGASKRLQTQLEGLADALPELEEQQQGSNSDDDWEGMSEDEAVPASSAAFAVPAARGTESEMLGALAGMVNVRKSIRKNQIGEGEGKMKMKTLTSNRGAAKRRAKLENKEIERFGKNLAEMSKPAAAAAAAAAGDEAGTSDRWAALRGFIGQTMERNPNFGKGA